MSTNEKRIRWFLMGLFTILFFVTLYFIDYKNFEVADLLAPIVNLAVAVGIYLTGNTPSNSSEGEEKTQ